jgi:toxin ParE1/3/4
MAEYRLTNAADADLLQIFVYSIQTFGLARAEAYRDSLLRCFQLLAEYPRLGRKADTFAPGARRHEHARHVIFYDDQPDGVLITAIIHQRNMPRMRGTP